MGGPARCAQVAHGVEADRALSSRLGDRVFVDAGGQAGNGVKSGREATQLDIGGVTCGRGDQRPALAGLHGAHGAQVPVQAA